MTLYEELKESYDIATRDRKANIKYRINPYEDKDLYYVFRIRDKKVVKVAENLAYIDAQFIAKCYNKFGEYIKETDEYLKKTDESWKHLQQMLKKVPDNFKIHPLYGDHRDWE